MLLEPPSMERAESVSSFDSFRSGLAATESLMMSILRGGSLDDIERMVGSADQEGALCSINDILAGGRSPLHLAVASRRMDAVQYLLDQGALTDQIDDTGHSALYYAVAEGQDKIVKLLLDHGADPFVQEPGNVMPIALDFSSDKMTRLLLKACARRIPTSVSPCPGSSPDQQRTESDTSFLGSPTSVSASQCAWTHYDLTSTSPTSGTFSLRNLLPVPRPRSGRYVLSEDLDSQMTSPPSCSESILEEEFDDNDSVMEMGKSHTLPRAGSRSIRDRRRASCLERVESIPSEADEPAFTRNSSARGSFRKCVDAAKNVFKRSSEETARRSLRRKGRRSAGSDERHTIQTERREDSTARAQGKLVPERDIAFCRGRKALVPRAPTTATIPPINTAPKSTAL